MTRVQARIDAPAKPYFEYEDLGDGGKKANGAKMVFWDELGEKFGIRKHDGREKEEGGRDIAVDRVQHGELFFDQRSDCR
jgi:hypothetical protein